MLLLNSTIQKKLGDVAHGRVARIGGTVNQLFTYNHCTVQDFNVLDGGYGNVSSWNSISNLTQVINVLKRRTWQELRHMAQGDRVPLDRETVIIDAHSAYTLSNHRSKYDCCISSNVIEHSYNPILLLLNFHFLTKTDGWQYHAIPHYKYTFDVYRRPTELDHFVEDFKNSVTMSDTTHYRDYIYSAIIKHGYKRNYHRVYPIDYPFIHFHVFDENNVRQLFEYVFSKVTVDVLRTDEFSDNVVLSSNKLNPRFVARHKETIKHYSRLLLK